VALSRRRTDDAYVAQAPTVQSQQTGLIKPRPTDQTPKSPIRPMVHSSRGIRSLKVVSCNTKLQDLDFGNQRGGCLLAGHPSGQRLLGVELEGGLDAAGGVGTGQLNGDRCPDLGVGILVLAEKPRSVRSAVVATS
jgi:hypothetical protein